MKCTNCGKNNAVYHYHFNLNGETQEAHLCAECAGKLAPEREFAAKSREMFGDMFDGFDSDLFGGGNMLKSFFGGDPFGDLFGGWSPFALLGAPRIEISFPETGRSRTRQVNELRAKLENAVKNEEYEQAAKLRDRLRALEKENG